MSHWTNRSLFFGLFFVLITLMVLWLVWPYLNTVLFSITIVVILSPIYNYFQRRTWVRGRILPTALTIIAFFFIIAIPITLLLTVTWYQGKELVADISQKGFVLEDFLADIIQRVQQLPFLGDFEFDRVAFQGRIKELIGLLVTGLGLLAVDLGTSLPNLLIDLFLFFGFLITLLPTAGPLIQSIKEMTPMEGEIIEIYIKKSALMIRSMFVGIFVLSFIQGLAMGLFYALAGIPYAALWTVLSIAFAVLPLVGISFIVIPMAIVLILTGEYGPALIVLGGFYGFVTWIDNLLRPKLVPQGAYLHPMLLLLSVFGGLAVAGLMGVVYGPVIMILFVTTIEVYRHYFLSLDKPGELDGEAASPA
jgi:predicted PurR-regulated permease PerM